MTSYHVELGLDDFDYLPLETLLKWSLANADTIFPLHHNGRIAHQRNIEAILERLKQAIDISMNDGVSNADFVAKLAQSS